MPAAVQRIGKGAVTASLSIGAADGWATPTAGNLLVVSANSDAIVTAPTGSGTWIATPSVVDNNAAYAWYKFATGTETTITCAPSTSDDIAMTAAEYSGVASFDTANTSTISGAPGGTSTNSAPVTTTAAGDLILSFAALHARNATIATGCTWTGGLTQVLTANSPVAGGTTECLTFVGELLVAGAAGLVTSAATWTNGYSDKQQITLAFKASAGVAFVPPPLQVIRQAVNRSYTY